MTNELLSKSVEELAPLLRNKSVSPVELTEAVLNRAEETEEKVNAYIEIYQKEAMESAMNAEKEIAAGNYRGMYHGIPMGIKDNIYFKDKITTMGSKIHKNFVPRSNATVVNKLQEAGVVFTGKLNMDEYAMSITCNNPHYGSAKNPWDVQKTPGGSSGGSGVSVAVGSSLASIGTDTSGSIRIPSAACGIVGLKPTRGRVSAHGIFPLSWTQDHAGPLTKTVKDAAGLLKIVAGFDDQDPVSADKPVDDYLNQITGDVTGLVIGIDEDYFFKDIDSGIEKPVRDAIMALADQGAKIESVKIPALKDAQTANYLLNVSEASAVHHHSIIERPEDFGEDIRGFLVSGAFPSSSDYAYAHQIRNEIIKNFDEIFQKVDVLISPTLPVMPNNIGEHKAKLNGEETDLLSNFIRLTGPANVAGIPALSVPCGFNGHLPVGMQIMGAHFHEGLILNTGYAIEQMNLLKGKHPNI